MPEPINKDDKPVVHEDNTPEVVLKFEDLDPEVQKFVDRERTQASKTAREKAMRDALGNDDIRNAIKAELEAEATLTAEQKLERRNKELDLKANRVDAREKLVQGGLVGEDLNEALELVVTEDSEATIAKVNKFLELVNRAVSSETEKLNRESLRKTPKPNASPPVTKEFKDMGFEERIQLSEKDPSRYKAEMEKLRSKI